MITSIRLQILLGALALAVGIAAPGWAEKIKVGVSAGPHAEIFEVVKGIAAKDGLDIEIVEFTDYVLPNAALEAGDIQANSFQHQPYLDNQVKDRGYKIVSVSPTVVFPMGFYSKKYKTLEQLPDGAIIAIPNDPTNGGRALLLLQSKGFLKLKDGVGLKPTIIDITENKKKLQIRELDAAQLPRSLGDVDAAAINTNYAIEAGLDPNKDAIIRETPNSPYTNLIAVRTADAQQAWVKKLVTAYKSEPVKAFVQERFKGSVVTSW